ncbi:hypothetical protein MUP32_06240 [Candidatus Microgenomates bacterium]|nr:hypothetical protein [Candidatus Microgenomates bacterium]
MVKKKNPLRFNKIVLLLPLALGLGFFSYFGAVKILDLFSQKATLSSWQTYKNDLYGFKLNYPLDYFASESTAKAPFRFSVQIVENKYSLKDIHYPACGVLVIETNLKPQDWLAKKATSESILETKQDFTYYGVKGITTLKVAGKIALQFESEAVSNYAKHTLIPKNGFLIDIFKLSTGIGEIPEEIYQKMLDSFKFTSS